MAGNCAGHLTPASAVRYSLGTSYDSPVNNTSGFEGSRKIRSAYAPIRLGGTPLVIGIQVAPASTLFRIPGPIARYNVVPLRGSMASAPYVGGGRLVERVSQLLPESALRSRPRLHQM